MKRVTDPIEAACLEAIGVKPHGFFTVVCKDKNGKTKWTERIKNMVTTEGMTKMLNVMFGSTSHPKITAWFIGLVDNAGTPALNAADTHASHAGWTEVTTYSNSTRVAFTTADLAATFTSISNTASVAVFNINGTADIYGVFLAATSTKGSTASGTLYSTAAFGAHQSVVNGDTLNITYACSLS